MQNVSYGVEFDLHENESADEFSEEWFRKKTRFETVEKGNLEMAYLVRHLPHCGQ